jgi:acetolactate synthase I/II/III large subunit
VTAEPNGAGALIGSLVAAGVDTCFANPGTSEMHFVAALDAVPGMRGVLALFEGVATGAADGYGRMAGRPATALLHLGPGLANGGANLHNAGKAHTPLVAVVGDHATYHKRLNAPLESDIDAIAGAVSGWVRRSWRPEDVGRDAADAVAAARRAPGQVATLILPADVSWSPGGRVAPPIRPQPPAPVSPEAIHAAVVALKSAEPVALLIGGPVAASEAGLELAAGIAAATGARLFCETFPPRLLQGSGRPAVTRLAYLAEAAAAQLEGCRSLVLVGAKAPVSFFAYPDLPGDLVPPGAALVDVGGPGDDVLAALEAIAAEVGAGRLRSNPDRDAAAALPTGPLNGHSIAAVVGALLPEGAIVVDEAVSSALPLSPALATASPHDFLTLPGGAIGFGLPAATGAACACPDRPVFCMEADGSAAYTITALWTQAREGLDVTTVIYDNRSYAILRFELGRVQAGEPGPLASDLLDLGRPDLDFVKLAEGFGVPAVRVTSAGELAVALRAAAAEPGPHLVDALMA